MEGTRPDANTTAAAVVAFVVGMLAYLVVGVFFVAAADGHGLVGRAY